MALRHLQSDMSELKYDNQAMTEYLLGSLPEAETERFDELSFTDEEFADVLKAVETDLVDAYTRDELAGRAQEKFKVHYLASPLRREKVEFAKAFQMHAERNLPEINEENFSAQELKPKQTISNFFSTINIFKTPNLALRGSFAVLALAFVFLSGWWIVNYRFRQQGETARLNAPAPTDQEMPKPVENSNTERELAAAANNENESPPLNSEKEKINKQPITAPTVAPKKSPVLPRLAIASFVLAPPLRGNNQIPSLTIPAQTETVAMQLQLEADDYAGYRVALINQSNADLWRSGTIKIKSEGDKQLNLRFPAKLLKSQIYLLVVSGINVGGEAEIISNYSFRAVVK